MFLNIHESIVGGTGMVSSISTTRPHLWRVIRGLFRMLYDVQHATGTLVFSDYSR